MQDSKSPSGGLAAGLAYALTGVTAFSLTLPMTSIAVAGLGPLPVAVWRALVAGCVALVILLLLRPGRPRGHQWWHLGACAFGTVFGFPLFSTLAMETVSASHGAVVIALLPMTTAIVAALVGHERPSAGFWLASVAGTAVTLTFVLRQAEGGFAIGHVYLMLANVTAGIGYAYGGLLTRTLSGWAVSCWAVVISLPILAMATLFTPPMNWQVDWSILGAFLYLALVSQLSGFFAWYRAMALVGIAHTSQVQMLQVFMTVGFAVLLLGESWDLEVIVFGAVVAAIVWLTTRLRVGSRPNPTQSPDRPRGPA